VRLLLDTHALLWWMAGDTRLSTRARKAIGTSDILVSAASVFEISIKVRLGKLPKVERLAKSFLPSLTEQGFAHLPVTVAHGLRAGTLTGQHADPFDRLLAAQAMIEDVPIISADVAMRELGANTFW
jgi:PIN domain nuclease of toxin-antitoxin system